MMVVSDTTPINYLILIGEIGLLPILYSEIVVPESVVEELMNVRASEAVRAFAMSLPGWVRTASPVRTAVPARAKGLGRGERQALQLALELAPAVILTDDRAARRVASMYSVATISTLRVLADAAEDGEISLEEAFTKLRATNFRVEDEILRQFLREDRDRKGTTLP